MYEFEIKHRDGLARIGVFHTPHGTITTPTILPVINPNNMIIPPSEMEERFGTDAVITNAYIIYKSRRLRETALEHGVHGLLGFDGLVMTDSGTFQSHVYGGVDVDPVEIVEFQRRIGTDIGTILDVFIEPDDDRDVAEEKAAETLRRAGESVPHAGEMGLAIPVQGGVFVDLRETSARKVSSLQAAVHPIGGVVPLMERYMYKTLGEVVLASKKGLNPARPVHLFGAGHPMLFPIAALMGCDLFDSASYIKYAMENRLLFPEGTKHLEDMTESQCPCPICTEHSPSDLMGMEVGERTRLIALHNLYVTYSEMKKVREAIWSGRIWELAVTRARTHPHLIEILDVLKKHAPWLSTYFPSSRPRGIFYTGPETLWRPEIHHAISKLFNPRIYIHKKYVIIPFMAGTGMEWAMKELKDLVFYLHSKYGTEGDVGALVETLFGLVPLELVWTFPFGTLVSPTLPETERFVSEVVEERKKRMLNAILENGWCEEVFAFDMDEYNKKEWLNDLSEPPADLPSGSAEEKERRDKKEEDGGAGVKEDEREESFRRFEESAMGVIADYQFFPGASELLLINPVFERSKSTGKIRTIRSEGKHVLSLRAESGLFSLKIAGAERFLEKNVGEKVVVDSETGKYNAEGKNVFAKFVQEATETIVPMDEVYVVDGNGLLLAVGRALLTPHEMKYFQRGIAVKVREGTKRAGENGGEN